MKEKLNMHFGIVCLIIVIAAATRLIDHPSNFTPIGAMALFGAAYFSKKGYSFLIPLIALWLSDLALNNIKYAEYYEGFSFMGNTWVYASIALIVAGGFFLLKKINVVNIGIASILAAVVFFLVTNFGSWLADPMYTKDFTGLMHAYEMGIPFFRNTLFGNVIYAGVMFGAYEWAKSTNLLSKTATA